MLLITANALVLSTRARPSPAMTSIVWDVRTMKATSLTTSPISALASDPPTWYRSSPPVGIYIVRVMCLPADYALAADGEFAAGEEHRTASSVSC